VCVIALLYTVFWNAFFQALLYLSDSSMWRSSWCWGT
jgi:hypothetical protein